MDTLTVTPTAVRSYGATHASIAAATMAAHDGACAAQAVALGPAFGLVGTEFLAAYAAAHTDYCRSVRSLAEAYQQISDNSASCTDNYQDADSSTHSSLTRIGG